MQSNASRHKKKWDRLKKQTIAKWMASLTVIVVVVTTIIIPLKSEVNVHFNSINTVGSTIVYDASIIDPNISIDPNSLYLDISSSLERFKVPLTIISMF